MPQEHKKRGRRAEAKKRKLDDEAPPGSGDDDLGQDLAQPRSKRRRTSEDDRDGQGDEFTEIYEGNDNADNQRPFYGLLDTEEQEYFKSADSLLENNAFATPEEQQLFHDNVFKEIRGKELKLACSQSCSRFLERLMLLANTEQLRQLFLSFEGQFASHCCETLFVRAAPFTTTNAWNGHEAESRESPSKLFEKLFISVADELSVSIGYLVTEKFASHVLRVLLATFSGLPVGNDPSNGIGSKKKERVDVLGKTTKAVNLDPRPISQDFRNALQKMIDDTVGRLDAPFLQNLALHPLGNPVLQILLRIELTVLAKHKSQGPSILQRLLPDDINPESQSVKVINRMLFDPVGSRLLEIIIVNSPGKLFKRLYKDVFRDRLPLLVRNDVSSYCVVKVLDRASPEDLEQACNAILPEIYPLAMRGRTTVIRALIERCAIRNIDASCLRDAILSCWSEEDGKTFSIPRMLDVPTNLLKDQAVRKTTYAKHSSEAKLPSGAKISTRSGQSTDDASILHRSLLAQTMLSFPGVLSDMLFVSMSAISTPACLHLASTSTLSPVLQRALTVRHATPIFRRKLITRFYSHIGALAMDPSGSHLIDAIWAGTQGMAFARERVAEELAENETTLRGNPFGRKVWRNWKMDLYKRRRADWVGMVRGEVGNGLFQSFPDSVGDGSSADGTSPRIANQSTHQSTASNERERPKTALDYARERHAENRRAASARRDGHGHASSP